MYDKRLDAIVKTADLGSFSKAAQALGYSVPALVKQVNGFEAQMGIAVFDRTNKGVQLTPGGKQLVSDARSIIAQCELALQNAAKAQAQADNLIRVGISLYQSGQRMLELCQRLYISNSDFSIQFVPIGDTFEAYREVVSNFEDRIDLFGSTYLAEVGEDACSIVPIAYPPLCISVPVNDPLALVEHLALSDLANRRIHVPERGNPYVDAARDEIEEAAPGIEFVEFRYYDISVFDECARLGHLLLSKELWRSVHPLMESLNVKWNLTEPYCLYFAKEPRTAVKRFVEALEELSGLRE
jgi:DNA-binding transcriptional LysR family regulator